MATVTSFAAIASVVVNFALVHLATSFDPATRALLAFSILGLRHAYHDRRDRRRRGLVRSPRVIYVTRVSTFFRVAVVAMRSCGYPTSGSTSSTNRRARSPTSS